MAGLNKVQLIGHLGADPEVRRTQSGNPVLNFRIATSESWKDKQTGERMERTEWHSIVIFNENLCEIAEKYLRKGSKAYVEGQLQTRKWQDQDGKDRYSTEIVLSRFSGSILLLDKADRPAREPDDYGTTRTREPAENNGGARPMQRHDEIPF
jgi:single-strand DNA-binding protein